MHCFTPSKAKGLWQPACSMAPASSDNAAAGAAEDAEEYLIEQIRTDSKRKKSHIFVQIMPARYEKTSQKFSHICIKVKKMH